MVTITDAALRQNVYETIYDLLDGLTYGSSSEPTVTAAFVDSSTMIPQVVVYPVDVRYADPVADRSNWERPILVLIEVYTSKNKDIDVIADKITHNLSTYSWDGMMLNDIEESVGTPTTANVKYHMKAISLTFIRR